MNDRFTPLDRLFQANRYSRGFFEEEPQDSDMEGMQEVDLDLWEEEEIHSGDWSDEIGYDPRQLEEDDWG